MTVHTLNLTSLAKLSPERAKALTDAFLAYLRDPDNTPFQVDEDNPVEKGLRDVITLDHRVFIAEVLLPTVYRATFMSMLNYVIEHNASELVEALLSKDKEQSSPVN